MTIAKGTEAWDTQTGKRIKDIPAGEYWINRYDEVEGKNNMIKPYVTIVSKDDASKVYRIDAAQNAMSSLKGSKEVRFTGSNLFGKYKNEEIKGTKKEKDTRPVVKIEWKDKK